MDYLMEKKDIKEITALTKVYSLLLWLIPVLEKFPRTQKFMLGDRIESFLMDIMDLIMRSWNDIIPLSPALPPIMGEGSKSETTRGLYQRDCFSVLTLK